MSTLRLILTTEAVAGLLPLAGERLIGMLSRLHRAG
jgi:hypothetical protein